MVSIHFLSLPKMASIGLLHDVPLSAEILLKSMVVMFYCIKLVYYIIDMYLIMFFHLFMLQEGHVIKFPLQVKWTRSPDMPFGMFDYIQSVTYKIQCMLEEEVLTVRVLTNTTT